jgi:hypothetical protein
MTEEIVGEESPDHSYKLLVNLSDEASVRGRMLQVRIDRVPNFVGIERQKRISTFTVHAGTHLNQRIDILGCRLPNDHGANCTQMMIRSLLNASARQVPFDAIDSHELIRRSGALEERPKFTHVLDVLEVEKPVDQLCRR